MAEIQEKLQPSPEEMNPRLLELINHLGELQSEYIEATSSLRLEYGIINRGCGPSSYFLSQMIKKRFPELKIQAGFSKNLPESDGIYIAHGYQIDPSRYFDTTIDHAWLLVRFDGQVAIVSPESSHHTADASFRGTIIYPHALDQLYKEIGLIPASEDDLHEQSLTQEEKERVKMIMTDINDGRVPEMYRKWYETLKQVLSK